MRDKPNVVFKESVHGSGQQEQRETPERERDTHLKPLAANVPDTRDRTPGSFWTKQLRTRLVKG